MKCYESFGMWLVIQKTFGIQNDDNKTYARDILHRRLEDGKLDGM
jgi:hypothetical protein